MTKYEGFEDLPVWQEAARLYNAVLDLLEDLNCPLTSGFLNQLDRAGLSVSNNIAEGFGRASTKERFALILELAKSCTRQITAWITSIENSSVKGKRYRSQAGIKESLG
jgi:four helix bundle protein